MGIQQRIISWLGISPTLRTPCLTSCLEDKPENYNTVTYELMPEGGSTKLTVTQDNLTSQEQANHTAQNWEMVLGTIKQNSLQMTQS